MKEFVKFSEFDFRKYGISLSFDLWDASTILAQYEMIEREHYKESNAFEIYEKLRSIYLTQLEAAALLGELQVGSDPEKCCFDTDPEGKRFIHSYWAFVRAEEFVAFVASNEKINIDAKRLKNYLAGEMPVESACSEDRNSTEPSVDLNTAVPEELSSLVPPAKDIAEKVEKMKRSNPAAHGRYGKDDRIVACIKWYMNKILNEDTPKCRCRHDKLADITMQFAVDENGILLREQVDPKKLHAMILNVARNCVPPERQLKNDLYDATRCNCSVESHQKYKVSRRGFSK